MKPVTHLVINSNKPLTPKNIPGSVTHLTFGDDFDQLLSPGVIPRSVTHLTFGYSFNHPLSPGVLPGSVTHITFGDDFDQPLSPGDIPESVTHLTFGYSFNQPLSRGDIPGSVTQLTFGAEFNQPLSPGDIPGSVTQLVFDYAFDQPLSPGDIPGSVTQLTFGAGFNQPLTTGVIPTSVTHIKFENDSYNHELPLDIETLKKTSMMRDTWSKFVKMSNDPSIDMSYKIRSLRKMYEEGYPVPVEPQENSLLSRDGVDKQIVTYFSLDRAHHAVCHNGFSAKLQYLIYQWIDNPRYGDFNSYITSLNMEDDTKSFTDNDFFGEYTTAYEAYTDMRNAIMTAPRSDHTIFAWRGMHGMDDLCINAVKGTYVGFSRFIACSVAQEVSCKFARDGVMMLIELPENTPLLNLTCIKDSEPEFILPDRAVFKVVNRTPYKSICLGVSCNELVHLRLVGIYTKDRSDFELYLDKDSPEEIRIDMVY